MADRTIETIGNYVLGPVLGRGGMSVVHAAEHRFLGDRVAIKLLRSHLAGDAAATAAFVAEATRTRAIDHPGVVRVLDFGSDGDAFYLVMERLDGESLAARLARCGRLDEPEVRRVGAAIADALAAAHDRGIVHRDLKPGNIVMVGDRPRVIDFGIAREVAAAATGSRLGTIAYMAPEQLTGGLIAPCVDIWALGVVLFEALAGRLPFDGFADGRSPQLFETAPRLTALAGASPALDAAIASCLERDPGKRPASMRAVAAALRAAPAERLTEDLAAPPAPSPSTPAAAAPRRRRSRRLGAAVATLAALAALGAGALAIVPRTADRSAPPAAVAAAAAREPAPTAAPREPATVPGPPSTATDAVAAPPPAAFTVEIRSAPAGAQVVLAGKRVGVTPATLALDAPASLLVTRAGYRPQRIRAERAGAIDVRLVPASPARRRPAAGETLD
ncbi:MAG TPA: serine/threonine-protein kinase [Kofleriaceae bacterium]|jgi:serine/threonine-protein kinase|nr:serine/threonine-protein kinase [Kofleriaceae bacterium]